MNKGKKIHAGILILLIIFVLVLYCSEADAQDSFVDGENIYAETFAYATEEDFVALERVLYHEAARSGCDLDVCKAVVETVLNRVLDPKWPDSIKDVCEDCRWGQQFCHSYYIPEFEWQQELVDDAISEVMREGPTILPSVSYQYFATKKQSLGKNHILLGDSSKRWKYLYFCEEK